MPETVSVPAAAPTLDKSNQARVYRSTNQSIASGTEAAIVFDTARFNPGGLWVLAVNPSRLTIAVAGVYICTGNLEFASATLGIRYATLRVNGTTTIAFQGEELEATGDVAYLSCSAIWQFAVNDYLELTANQSSGAALNVLAAVAFSPELALQRIG